MGNDSMKVIINTYLIEMDQEIRDMSMRRAFIYIACKILYNSNEVLDERGIKIYPKLEDDPNRMFDIYLENVRVKDYSSSDGFISIRSEFNLYAKYGNIIYNILKLKVVKFGVNSNYIVTSEFYDSDLFKLDSTNDEEDIFIPLDIETYLLCNNILKNYVNYNEEGDDTVDIFHHYILDEENGD